MIDGIAQAFQDPSFWVFLAFLTLWGLVGKNLWQKSASFLDDRRTKIQNHMEQAQRLKEEAASLKEEAVRLQHATHGRVQEMMAHTKIEIQRLKDEAEQTLRDHLDAEERQLMHKISFVEQRALADIQRKAVDIALDAAKIALMQHQNPRIQDHLFHQALDKIPRENHEKTEPVH